MSTLSTGSGSTPGAIRAVFFDVGGVLVDSPFGAFSDYETRAGLPSGALRMLNQREPDRNAWACAERGEIDREEFFARFEAEARAHGHAVDARALFAGMTFAVRPAMVALLQRLRGRYILACVTNNMKVGHGAVMAATPEGASEIQAMFALVDHVVESCRVGVRKPEAAFYRIACERAGVQPHEVVFLDDLGINLKPARALGMHTIKVDEPGPAIAALEALLGLPTGA
jgi:putative hydrolase of the HAD superfamily